MPDAALFEAQRPRLHALAYRMLGSVADAEDIVQETYLRLATAAPAELDTPPAWLVTIATRLCLDRLRRARRERASYVGPWLPEPVIDAPDAPLTGDITHAVMAAMERLSPLERAAFLLHDIFEVDHATIADTLERDIATCRQLARRARLHLQGARPRYTVSREAAERLTRAFLTASRQGDLGVLNDMLAEEVVFLSDGGGRRYAAINPVIGLAKVAALFAGLARKRNGTLPHTVRHGWIDGLPGYLSIEPDDGLPQSTALDIEDTPSGPRITAIYVMRNPDKLNHLSPIG